MPGKNNFIDDLSRLAGSAASTLADVRGEIAASVRSQTKKILANMNIVSREEFTAVQAEAEQIRLENEALACRIAALEAAGSAPKPAAKPKGAAKTKAAPKSAALKTKKQVPARENSAP